MSNYAIIVAGGIGSRMDSEIPKQFLMLDGKPLLMHTLEKFVEIPDLHIILALPKNQVEQWKKLCDTYLFSVAHAVVLGGDTRFESVKNGLECITDNTGVVAVHDGVRPFVSTKLIKTLFEEASNYSNAIPFTYPKETIRKIEGTSSVAVNRSSYRLIQTPQCFDLAKLKKAYEVGFSEHFTDDASVFEKDGNRIHLVPGEYSNIKITTPDDLRN